MTITSISLARPSSWKYSWAASSGMKITVLSYSYMPTSKIAPISYALMRGTVPSAVGVPLGEISWTRSPGPTPMR